MNSVLHSIVQGLLITIILSILVPIQMQAAIITVPDDIASIRGAIAIASPGDEIFVREGVYLTDLIVNKKLTIYGEISASGELLTILDGGSKCTVVTITADECILRDLIVQNSEPGMGYAGISIESNNNILHNNIIRFCSNGICIDGKIKNKIFDSFFYQNGMRNIMLEKFSDRNSIRSNEFQTGGLGINITESNKNTIANNVFSLDVGVYITRSSENRIEDNEFACDHFTALDDTNSNFWRRNGWSNYEALSGPYEIDGGGFNKDPEPYIAFTRDYSPLSLSPTIVVPDDFATISAAVAAASAGDRIFVKAGVYPEYNVDLEKKKLIIFGEVSDKGQLMTILDAENNGCGFHIRNSSIQIHNMIIQNAFDSCGVHNTGIYIYEDCSGAGIYNCVIRDCPCGIQTHPDGSGNWTSIKQNVFYNNVVAGILTRNTHGFTIWNNQFHIDTKTDRAIILENDVTGCAIVENTVSTGKGIYVLNSNDNYIAGNEITTESFHAYDNTGLNDWFHNGFGDYRLFRPFYTIQPGLVSDLFPHIAYARMY